MTTINTKHLRELAEAATPGPWEAETWTHQFDDEITFGYVEANECSIWDHSGGNTVANAADADYIAAIDPPTLIALLDELEGHRRWKAEAVDVLLEWEKTWVAAGRPGRLGTSKAVGVRDEIERLRGDTEWEYGNTLISTDGHPTGLVMPAGEGEVEDWGLRRVRRRKAGPWELVEEKTDD